MDRIETEDELYLPLATNDTIRLLEFKLLGDSHAARFVHVKISESPSYVALSYVWGKTEEWPTFEIDGWDVPITLNLFAFFHYLVGHRSPQQAFGLDATDENSQVYLWIDALCINQGNIPERNQQVRLMKQIYEKASKVVVWLGAMHGDNETEELAIGQLSAVGKWLGLVLDRTGSVRGIHELQQKPLTSEEDLQGVKELSSSERWAALGDFITKRQWWQRMWTVQESATQVEKVYMFANLILDSTRFEVADLVYQWLRKSKAIAISSQADRGFDLIGGRRRSDRMGTAGGGLYELLVLLSRNEATDPRDKVYAALGLTDGVTANNVIIDYSLSTSTVYLQTARQILQSTKGLEWLAAASHQKLDDLPSWVPDWSSDRFGLGLFKTGDNGSNLYNASGQVEPQNVFFDPKEADAKLNLKGIYVDRIMSVASSNDLENLAATSWVVEMLIGLSRTYEATGQTFYEALHRTFLMDCVWSVNGTPESRGLRFLGGDLEQAFQGKKPVDILAKMTQSPMLNDTGRNVDMKAVFEGRCLAITSKGYIALVPATSAVGDHIVVLVGSHVPHVLRPALDVQCDRDNKNSLFLLKEQDPGDDQNAEICTHVFMVDGGIEMFYHSIKETCLVCTDETCQYYKLIGETYVHGLMDGEALGLPNTGGVRHIVLV